jgi:hypothetical protein
MPVLFFDTKRLRGFYSLKLLIFVILEGLHSKITRILWSTGKAKLVNMTYPNTGAGEKW